MELAWDLILLVVALAVLVKLADVIVDSVLTLSRRYRLPRSVVGASVAAAATSAPELATNLAAVASARGDAQAAAVASIGVGSILGSAVFNLTVVVGLVALVGTTALTRSVMTRDGSVYAAATCLAVAAMAFIGIGDAALSRLEGLFLLAAYLGYVFWLVRDARAERARIGPVAEPERAVEAEVNEGEPDDGPNVSHPVLRLCGAVLMIAVAAHFLVESTRGLAELGASTLGIGATATSGFLSLIVVAGATSIPDALTSLAAARRGEGALAVSNALGSNTFDILVGIGLPALIVGGYAVSREMIISGVFLVGTAVWVPIFLSGRSGLGRMHAVVLFGFYALFLALVVWLTASTVLPW